MKQINWKPNAALFLGAQCLTLFGSALVQFAITWYVTLETGSGAMLTAFVVINALPMFFISPFAGVWADRFNKKYLINIADALIAVTTLFVALCFMFGYKEIWLLWLCAGIRALGQGVQMPAVNSFIPLIVPEEHYARVNGINTTIQSLSNLVAPMLAGLVLGLLSISAVFFIDIITAIIGISVVFFLVKAPVQEHTAADSAARYFHDIKEGLLYIRAQKWLIALIVISTLFFLFVAPLAFLTNLKVTRDYGNDVWRLTAHELVFSVGMFLGGVLISVWGGFKNRSYSMGLGNLLIGAGTIAIGLAPHFWAYIVFMGFVGLVFPIYSVVEMSLVQEKVDAAYMGRVFSVFGMLGSVFSPLGMLVFGPLSDIINLNMVLIVSGVVVAALGFPFFLFVLLREAGDSRTSKMSAE